jgi:hypothetical protein
MHSTLSHRIRLLNVYQPGSLFAVRYPLLNQAAFVLLSRRSKRADGMALSGRSPLLARTPRVFPRAL